MRAADVGLGGAYGRRVSEPLHRIHSVWGSSRRFFRLALSRLVRPRSFVTLMVLGFITVAVPLSTAFVASSIQLEELASHGRDAVYRAVQSAHDARGLAEQLGSMERLARQYAVTRDRQRLQAYEHLRQDVRRALERQLDYAALDESASGRFAEIAANEAQSFETLRAVAPQTQESRAALELLSAAAAGARIMVLEENRNVRRVVDEMQRIAERARRILFWHAIAAVPLAVVLAVVFFLLIARPVRAIDRAIRGLGAGNFETAISIAGPRDLEELGRRLDWLRVRLLELEDQKKRFLRHVSHELKTPLTTIREGSELLAHQVVGPLNDRQSEVAGILRDNTLRLQKLIEDLLAFSRLLAVRDAASSHECVNLDVVIRSICRDYKLAINRRALRLNLDLERVQVEGNRVKLRTLVDNLLSNAVKYTPDDGCINVVLSRTLETARLDVIDSGAGVAVHDRERIFDAFFQSDDQPLGPVRGTGLGLSIAREIARSHGGEVTLLPAGDSGAHFRVTLPVAKGNSGACEP